MPPCARQAPEIFKNKFHKESEVYAFAMVIWEVLTATSRPLDDGDPWIVDEDGDEHRHRPRRCGADDGGGGCGSADTRKGDGGGVQAAVRLVV